MKIQRIVSVAAAVVVGLGAVTAANAAWNFPTGGSFMAASVAATGSGSSVALTSVSGAYAANGGTLSGPVGAIQLSSTYGISGFGAGAKWATDASAALQGYGPGLGMASDSPTGTAPNHAIDNGPATNSLNNVSGLGNTESVLLNFASSVVLSGINIGYRGIDGTFGDSDISLFRWTGVKGSTASLSGVGATLTEMQTAGWELVSNYNLANVGSGAAGDNTVNTGAVGSSWWLISAYNSAYASGGGANVDQGNDYFKIYSVAGTDCVGGAAACGRTPQQNNVPEPGSLALVAIAGLAAIGARRRQKAVAAA